MYVSYGRCSEQQQQQQATDHGKLGGIHGSVHLDRKLGAPAHLFDLSSSERGVSPAALRVEGAH